MNITDEMHAAYRAGRHEHRIRDAHHSGPNALGGECCDRAGLTRAAPLIAAQALRQAADVLLDEDRLEPFGHDDRCGYGPPGTCDCQRGEAYRWLVGRANGLAACPTCSGPTRETVGMVCQTCGTDYAPDAP